MPTDNVSRRSPKPGQLGSPVYCASPLLWPSVLLKCEKLLRAEGFIVDLSRSLDQILQVSPEKKSSFVFVAAPAEATHVFLPRQEIAQVHELAMCLVLDIYHTPAVFPSAHSLPTDDHITLRANHGEWNHVLYTDPS